MFGLGPATKIYVAVEAVDMRKGFEGLYGLVRDHLGQNPLSGHLFLFTNRARTPESAGVGRQRAMGMRELTVFTLHLFQFQADILEVCLQTCRSIN